MNDTQNRRGPASDPGEQYRETIFSFKTCFAPTLGVALLGLGAGAIAAPFLKSSAPLIALLGLTIYLLDHPCRPCFHSGVYMAVIAQTRASLLAAALERAAGKAHL